MPVVMSMRWAGVTPQQYDAVRGIVNWEGDTPAGGLFHVSWFDSEGLRATDLWESAADFERFARERLMPGVQQVGISGEPQVEITEAHAVFAPGFAG